MEAKFVIRKLTPEDIPNLKVLQGKIFPVTYSDAVYEKFTTPRYLSMVIERIADGRSEIVGISTSFRIWFTKWSNKRDAYISTFGIDDRYRNIGLGSQLLKLTCDINFRHYQAKNIRLHNMKDNVSGFNFYRKRGFIGQRVISKFYKIAEKMYDAVYMSMHDYKESDKEPQVKAEVSPELTQLLDTVDTVPCFLPYFYANP